MCPDPESSAGNPAIAAANPAAADTGTYPDEALAYLSIPPAAVAAPSPALAPVVVSAPAVSEATPPSLRHDSAPSATQSAAPSHVSSTTPSLPPAVKLSFSLSPSVSSSTTTPSTLSLPSSHTPSPAAVTAAVLASFPISSTTPHKRSREPCATSDPIEAARYTPPREMFKPVPSTMSVAVTSIVPSTVPTAADSDDQVSLPSDDSMHDTEDDNNNQSESQPQPIRLQEQRRHDDSELDGLGQQLSINSPGRTAIIPDDNEIDAVIDQDRNFIGPQKPTHQLQQSEEMPDLEEEEGSDSQAATITPEPDEQWPTIRALTFSKMEEGEEWYLIDMVWWGTFRKHCLKSRQGTADHPGPIDNSDLLSGDKLRDDAQHRVQTVPKLAWDLLSSWYGAISAPIIRRVVNTGTELSPNLMIDYYPPVFTIYRVVDADHTDDLMSAMTEPETIEVPRSTKFGDLKSALVARMSTSGEARIWALPQIVSLSAEGNTISANAVASMDATCLDNIDDDLELGEVTELIRVRDLAVEVAVDGKYLVDYSPQIMSYPPQVMMYPRPISPISFSRDYYGSRSSASPAATLQSPAEGLCGLQNLGNTCFMNSALQCLSNIPDLTHFILSGAWRDELNLDNPLGMNGEVARAYASIIDKLWNGRLKMVAPREFKSTIGRFAPSFTGYHQHDSQELLAFLLDGLHEDLNRIIKKPYTETPESKGRPDEEVANDFWQVHKARNDSVIVDLFQGQYKSTLVCPECQKISVTFDPFMYLSLPLPINKKWTGTVTYVPYDVRQPLVDISVQLPKGSSQRQLKEKIADMMGTQAGRLFSAEVFQNRFYKSHENWEMVDELGDADKTFIYELPVADFTNAPDHVVFPVFSMMDITHFSFGKPPMIGHPMLVCVSKEEAKDPEAIVAAIAHQAKRYTTVDLFEAASASDDTPEDAQEDLDMDLIEPATSTSSSSAQTTTRVKKGIFRVGAFTPPSPQQSKYRSMMKPSLYAPMNHPTLDSMTDIFERAAASRDSDSERELDVYHVQYHRTHSTMEDDDNEAIGSNHYARPGSPSTLSDSSRSSNRPPVAPQDSEQSEDDDEVNLARVPKREPKLPPSPEPLVRHGDLLYCLWDQSVEQGITSPKKYRSFSSRAFDDEPVQSTSTLRALWDERGASVTDPVIQEEIMAAKRGRKTITLEDCLNEFTKEEQLGEEDLWYCPDCKKHQQATKKLDIWRFPDVLVVHLKRFSHTRSWRDKLDALVDFPIEGLDLGDRALKELQQGDNIYDLFGVSNHMGGLGGGHYTAYAKNEKQDRWYCFDDSHVSPVQNQESIKTSSAYLLFYRRRSAPIKEYEQRPPVADPEPEPELVPYSMGRAFGPSMERADDFMIPYGPRPLHDQDDDDIRFGPWGKPPSSPYQDIGPSLSLEDSDREGLGNILDDDDELPMYSSSIGPASLLVDSKDFMTNKKARVSQDFDHLDNDDLYTDMGNVGHSPDLSTCASDGSNPGTANASPRFSPIQ